MTLNMHGPGGRVLIADGDRGIGESAARELCRLGHDAVVTTEAVDTLAALHDAEFDVAIIDRDLPPRGGEEVRRAARQLSPDVEIIFSTSGPADAAGEAIWSRGFDVLRRPFELHELARVVARAAEHRRLHTTTALYVACSVISGKAAPERLPTVLVDLCRHALEADDVILFLPRGAGKLSAGYVSGAPSVDREARTAVAEAALAENGARAVFAPQDTTGSQLVEAASRARLRSLIVHPLAAGDRLVGVLLASRSADPRPFRKADVDRATVLAAPILLALENTRLLAQMVTSERLAAVGQLAAGVAHEINNPLSYVISNQAFALDQVAVLDALAADPSPANARAMRDALNEIRGALVDAQEGTDCIREIARDLTTMSRSSTETPELVDVSSAARAALRLAAARVRQSANVIVDLAESAHVLGSPGRLCQVFVNLIVNAAQAAEGAASPVDLFVSTARVGDRVVATVRDTGPGIASEDLGRLFDSFFTTKASGAGTGLGLAVTRQIVEAMGGEIVVVSPRGGGATFTLTFPAAKPAGAGGSSAPASMKKQERMRLLFIDDEFPLLRCYERWFGRDHDVVTVQDAEQVLGILRDQPDFTAIVCDVVMPRASGPEVYMRVKTEFPELARRFAFVTGASGDPEVAARLAAFPCPVLPKPVDLTALRATLEQWQRDKQK